MSDLIDNRKDKLADAISEQLGISGAARFAVGYFFLSGLEKVAHSIENVGELKLLIGNTTNRQTIEQMAEGYRRLDAVADELEEELFVNRRESRKRRDSTAHEVGDSLAVMDQTDESERLVKILVEMIADGRLKVRVYTRGTMHAKAYLFDYPESQVVNGKEVPNPNPGVAIVGSSNFTLSGIASNTELNVYVHGNDNHAQIGEWFDELWDEAEDFDNALMREMELSWAAAPVKPHDIYMKTLYTLVRDRLDAEQRTGVLPGGDITEDLADFQKVAFRQAVQLIRTYRGAFVADVVGLGKSYIGAAIVKHFEQTERCRPLIICPRPLVEMWERYNEVYELNARVVSIGLLREGEQAASKTGIGNPLLDDMRFRDRDFILIDESHNFRNHDTQRYRVLDDFLNSGKGYVCMLTATPRNKTAWDVYNQIKLFHPEETTNLPIDPPHLRDFFRLADKGERHLPDLLSSILIRRTRNHILRWYGYDSTTNKRLDPARFDEYLSGQRRAYVLVNGKHQYFPRRRLETVEYRIEDAYNGLYDDIRGYIGQSDDEPTAAGEGKAGEELLYARYGLGDYVKKSKQSEPDYVDLRGAGRSLRGLIRILLFKRFESSVDAFRKTIERLLSTHLAFLTALEQDIIPAGDEAQRLLYHSDTEEEAALMDALKAVSGRYAASDFDVDALERDLWHDIGIYEEILRLVKPITPDEDAKLLKLKEKLGEAPLNGGKVLIFSQYADTARYLYDNLVQTNGRGLVPPDKLDVIFSGDKSKERAVGRFAPKANPEYVFQSGDTELSTLIATDVLSEGLNMQDGDKIINYDLHWNPVRLIQRFGRIDRIGSEYEHIYGYNFLPETGIEENLGLREKLTRRIREIQQTIGDDVAILDPTETLNPEAMYAIYEGDEAKLGAFEEEEGGDVVDLGEAVEMFRQMREERPGEFERIAELRDGIRSARSSNAEAGTYVFCQAGGYQQLYLADAEGNIVARDTNRLLRLIRCEPGEPTLPLPDNHNAVVMKVKRQFAHEVKQRRSEQKHRQSLSRSQEYVRKELGMVHRLSADERLQEKVQELEGVFTGTLSAVVKRELNVLQRGKVKDDALVDALDAIYAKYKLGQRVEEKAAAQTPPAIPRVVCSERLYL